MLRIEPTITGTIEKLKALVTGGAGFIGSNLVRALLERGDEVRVLDNFSTGYRGNLEQLDVELVEGDLRSYERVATAVNVEGTLNVLLAARDAGVRRVVFASSSSVYGNAPGMPRRETQAVAPLAPYAVSKLAAEQYCMVANRVFGVEAVALRYFNVFGEHQDPSSGYAAVIPKFIRILLDGAQPTIFGDGETSRDFTHVENVVEANLAAALAPAAAGRVMNVAIGHAHTLNELVRTLARLLDSDLEPDYAAPRAGDVRESVADVSLARELIGYEPSVDLEEGLERTIAWIVEQRASYEARSV